MNTLYHPGAALNQQLMGAGRFIPPLLPGWGGREELVRVPSASRLGPSCQPEWWLSRPSQTLVPTRFPGPLPTSRRCAQTWPLGWPLEEPNLRQLVLRGGSLG